MGIWISVIGAVSAVTVAVVGAVLSNKNSNMLELKRLKEEHYTSYIEALHMLASKNGDRIAIEKYTLYRDKLLVVGSEDVLKNILIYEKEAFGKENKCSNEYLTNVITAIRKDLKIKDKDYPIVGFVK